MAGDVNKGWREQDRVVADGVQYANELWPVALSPPQGCYKQLPCSFTFHNCVNITDHIFV